MEDIDILLDKTGEGDRQAFEALYIQLKDSVYGFALSILKNRELAEDALQDTFIKIFRLADTRKHECSGRAWIFTITRNQCLDILRKHHEIPSDFIEDGLPLKDDSNDFMSSVYLRDALSKLSPKSAQTIILHLVCGFTFKEAARILGMTQAAVEWRYYSSVKKLSDYYEIDANHGKGDGKNEEELRI